MEAQRRPHSGINISENSDSGTLTAARRGGTASSDSYTELGDGSQEMSKGRSKRSLISRTLERCRSLGKARGARRNGGEPPVGYFSVYVGPARERFVVRTECLNHPLFRALLDEAEREYGHAAQGPLALPCAVEAFLDVLWEMEHEEEDPAELPPAASPICGLANCRPAPSGYRLLSPARTPAAARRASFTSPLAPSRK